MRAHAPFEAAPALSRLFFRSSSSSLARPARIRCVEREPSRQPHALSQAPARFVRARTHAHARVHTTDALARAHDGRPRALGARPSRARTVFSFLCSWCTTATHAAVPSTLATSARMGRRPAAARAATDSVVVPSALSQLAVVGSSLPLSLPRVDDERRWR